LSQTCFPLISVTDKSVKLLSSVKVLTSVHFSAVSNSTNPNVLVFLSAMCFVSYSVDTSENVIVSFDHFVLGTAQKSNAN
jgi:hypothetical protein